MQTLIKNGKIVNEGRTIQGYIIIADGVITEVGNGNEPRGNYDEVVDASGCVVLPGIIDEHVHFREPGLESKADIASESRAAAAGGVTTFFDMPNTVPQTTTLEALNDKFTRGKSKSRINYAFFFGATNDNYTLFKHIDKTLIPGIKLFMGASTGNMLVDRKTALENIFKECSSLDLPLMTHCEDSEIINQNMAKAKRQYGEDPDVRTHELIRSREACLKSSSLAATLAHKYGTKLHIAHISTAEELKLLTDNITGEAVLAHLLFTNHDYTSKGALIKCNPSVKTNADREALRSALSTCITTIGTDHAPHLLKDKQGGAAKAASGMPMVQFSLVAMLSLMDEGIVSLTQLVNLMCHNPAHLFSVNKRGFIRPGYQADIVIIRKGVPWTLNKSLILSKCGWSPLEGRTFNWHIERTMCNGHTVYDWQKGIDDSYRGQQVRFRS